MVNVAQSTPGPKSDGPLETMSLTLARHLVNRVTCAGRLIQA